MLLNNEQYNQHSLLQYGLLRLFVRLQRLGDAGYPLAGLNLLGHGCRYLRLNQDHSLADQSTRKFHLGFRLDYLNRCWMEFVLLQKYRF